jgi:predicted outer membrane protein
VTTGPLVRAAQALATRRRRLDLDDPIIDDPFRRRSMKRYAVLAAVLAAVSTPALAQTMATPAMAPLTTEGFRTMAMAGDAFEIESSRLALERSRNPAVRRYAQEMIRDHAMTSQALNGGQPVYTTGYGAAPSAAGGTATGALGGAVVGGLVGGPVGAAVGAGVGATAGSAGAAAGGSPSATGSTATGAVGGAVIGGLVGGPIGALAGAGIGATTGGISGGARGIAAIDPRKAAMLNELSQLEGRQFDAAYVQYQVMSHRETVAMYASYAQSGTNPAMRAYTQQALPHLEHHLMMAERLAGGRTRSSMR